MVFIRTAVAVKIKQVSLILAKPPMNFMGGLANQVNCPSKWGYRKTAICIKRWFHWRRNSLTIDFEIINISSQISYHDIEGLLGWNFVLCNSTLPYDISGLITINDEYCDCFITQPSCHRIPDGEGQCRPDVYPAMHSQPCGTKSSMPDDLREVITDAYRSQTL